MIVVVAFEFGEDNHHYYSCRQSVVVDEASLENSSLDPSVLIHWNNIPVSEILAYSIEFGCFEILLLLHFHDGAFCHRHWLFHRRRRTLAVPPSFRSPRCYDLSASSLFASVLSSTCCLLNSIFCLTRTTVVEVYVQFSSLSLSLSSLFFSSSEKVCPLSFVSGCTAASTGIAYFVVMNTSRTNISWLVVRLCSRS